MAKPKKTAEEIKALIATEFAKRYDGDVSGLAPVILREEPKRKGDPNWRAQYVQLGAIKPIQTITLWDTVVDEIRSQVDLTD